MRALIGVHAALRVDWSLTNTLERMAVYQASRAELGPATKHGTLLTLVNHDPNPRHLD